MALPEYVRPQRHNGWFSVAPLRDLTGAPSQRLPIFDTFVTVHPTARGYDVRFEGTTPLIVEQHHGFLCVWYGDDLTTPRWPFPVLFDEPYDVPFAVTPPREFEDTNLLDLIENNGDLIHFKTVHHWLSVKLSDHSYDERVFRLKMAGRIQYARSADAKWKRKLAARMPVWEYSQDLAFHGPGFGAGQITTDQGIDAQLILAFMPIGENNLRLHVAARVNPAGFPKPMRKLDALTGHTLHRGISWAIAKAGIDDTDGDYRIWRYKRSLSDPKLLPNEQDIVNIREWMAQYYMDDFAQPKAAEEREPEWSFLANTQDVVPGEINTFRVADEELVAYCDDEGELRVFDAYCPHQGAHLGHGKLKDGCLGCPFHEFYFDGDGAFRGTSPDGKKKKRMRLTAIPVRRTGQRIEVRV